MLRFCVSLFCLEGSGSIINSTLFRPKQIQSWMAIGWWFHFICSQGQLNKALAEPVEALLDAAAADTWSSVRNLLQRETESATSGFASALATFDLDQATIDKMIVRLKEYGRSVVESKAREEAGRVLIRMKDR